jgi:hypothetical protein
MKAMKEEKVGVCSLAHITSGVEGHVGAPKWGVGQVTSRLIIHTDLHKPNKLVSVWLEHVWCRMNHRHTHTHNKGEV